MSNCHFPVLVKEGVNFGEWVALKLLKKKVFDVFIEIGEAGRIEEWRLILFA